MKVDEFYFKYPELRGALLFIYLFLIFFVSYNLSVIFRRSARYLPADLMWNWTGLTTGSGKLTLTGVSCGF